MPNDNHSSLPLLVVSLLAATTLAAISLAPAKTVDTPTNGLLLAGQAAAGPSLGCPATQPPTTLSARAGAARTLVPQGARSLLLCSYHGLNPASTARRLEQGRLVQAAAELTRLTGELDALRQQPGIVFHCPLDDGSEILAIFRYPSGAPNPVSVGLTGCQIVSNGHVNRTASLPPGPTLIGQLEALLR